MSRWNYPGARWWKFDFHTHTHASSSYFMQGHSQEDKDQVTPQFWLQKFMEKSIDCVAITDHDSGEWIDKLSQELAKTEKNKPDWYRPLYLFPGVEISVYGGVHLLAIFGKDKTQSDIDRLLGAVGAKDGNVTTASVTDVTDKITERGGIAIPAHADKKKGLFEELKGKTLELALDNSNIHAMELCDDDYEKPQLYKDKKLQWTSVRGSDTHNFQKERFGSFTWVKMDTPSVEGLKLALTDGTASVNRNMNDNPNQHAEFVIEELTVENAKYIGRSGVLTCQFNPFLNTIIGGRGSGKSSLLEFMRFALRRNQEIPESLRPESDKYFQVGDDNLLTENSRISLVYRKGDTRYRLNWSAQADIPSLEVCNNNDWEMTEGEIQSLFPVYIYSQKQIFELAKNPQALIDIIDKAPSVGYEDFRNKHNELKNRYKAIEQKLYDLTEKVSRKNKLQGEFNDLSRQIHQIEQSGHKAILQNYRKRQQQLAIIESLENDWNEMADRLPEMQESVAPANFNAQYFDEFADILSAINQSNSKWQEINWKLKDLSQEAKSVVNSWKQKKDASIWMRQIEKEISQYEQLRTQLEQQGIEPAKYPALLRQQAVIKKQLENIEAYSSQIQVLTDEKFELLKQIEDNRKALTENRQTFLASVLEDNPRVNIKVRPRGEDWNSAEKRIRELLQCPGKFDKDIDALKNLYKNNDGVAALKNAVLEIYKGEQAAKDSRFAAHLQKVPHESINDLILWFPKDDLEITFGNHQKITQASPGQKTAALLAFILSYGEEPLLLDQPEDDLDNEVIYRLIVKQLREMKSKRQIIIVTHNANIVVNGDAEMVLPLTVRCGQTRIQQPASIQNQDIRQKICDILEGGQQAFSQRYKRIHLEN